MSLAAAARTLHLLVVTALLVMTPAGAVGQVPPDERYLQFETDHFRVVFPEGMEPFARRAAASAEWAHGALSEHFIEPPEGRIALVVTDFTDRPNASATPIPTNRVVLIAAPDIASQTLNYYTDWVDLTMVHELTHIFHLDRADGIWGIGQAVFGRVPVFFPAFYQPRWVIEGLATYYESRLTGAGRAYGSSFDMLLNNDADAGRFRDIDAADGLSPIWPAGNTRYAYGGLYFRSIAEARGDSIVAEFTRRGAKRLPYTLNWASTPYFGRTLTGSWNDWKTGFESSAQFRSDSLRALGLTAGEPLSEIAWVAPAPRHSPDGRYLAFSLVTPRDDPATIVLERATGRIVLRERSNGSGVVTWARDGSRLYRNQLEFADRYDIYSDLYSVEVAKGKERRLTVGARLSSPDVSPDGQYLVAVQTAEGTNRLVLVDLGTGEQRQLTAFTDGVNWERPRWSPDGDWIAAERWERGRVIDVVALDTEGEVAWYVTRDEAADVSPAWSPDGRFLLWASDRDGAYDIYAAEVPGTRATEQPALFRVTRTISGATDPDVSPDGRSLAFAALYPHGIRVERVAYDPASWEPAGPGWRRLRRPPSLRTIEGTDIDQPVRPYNPFPSLWPKSWLPIVFTGSSTQGTFIGATTFGTDDVRRHSYAILAGWRTGIEAVEAAAGYRYAGFGDPVLELALAQDYSTFSVLTTDGDTVSVVERDRDVRLALNFLRPRIRTAWSFTPIVGLEFLHLDPIDPGLQFSDPNFDDLLVGVLAGFSRARGYPRSVSSEKGFVALLELDHRRDIDNWDRWRVSAESQLRGYLSFPAFGFSNHVVAGRLAFGASDGHDRSAEIFELGGVPGRAIDVIAGLEIGGGSRYAVRGFSEGVELGDRIASANLEYRFPLALVGRGYGLWPILLDRLSASLFFDAGSAWFDSDDIDVIASAGTELSMELGLNYAVVYRFRLGLARQLEVPEGSTADWSVYLAAGVAF